MSKLTDWIDGTNGIRYAFDDAGALTKITDYDNSTLAYEYNGGGQLTTMTDYHNNTTYTCQALAKQISSAEPSRAMRAFT